MNVLVWFSSLWNWLVVKVQKIQSCDLEKPQSYISLKDWNTNKNENGKGQAHEFQMRKKSLLGSEVKDMHVCVC